MGLGTLNNRVSGQTILDTFFNDIHGAMNGDFVGRNSSGVPTSGQNLGTAALPWGTVRASGLVLNGSSVDTSQLTSEPNRIISGKERSTSNQPAFITPNGAAASFILAGATTNLVIDINGTTVTVSTDITKSSLTTAPAANNTCLVNDTTAADQDDTRLWGEPEHKKTLTVDTMGSEISALVGTYAAFKIDNGSSTEYFYGYIASTTEIKWCRRGFFYDSSLAPKNRIVFSNNDTITLMKLGWVFITNDATTVDVSYTNPTWAYTAPSSPVTGDYWYDLANKTWKRYDGASFQIISRTLIGQVVMDSSNCVAARCVDFYANYERTHTLDLEIESTSIIRSKKPFSIVNVAGQTIRLGTSTVKWNITTDLASSADLYNASEQASTMYYLYLKDDGKPVVSDISPYYRNDLLGKYHPHNPWRCVGMAYNNASSNFTVCESTSARYNVIRLADANANAATNTLVNTFSTEVENYGCGVLKQSDATSGTSFLCTVPGTYHFSSAKISGAGTSRYALFKNPVAAQLNNGTASNVDTYVDITAVAGNVAGAGSAAVVSADVKMQIGDVCYFAMNGNFTDGTCKINVVRIPEESDVI